MVDQDTAAKIAKMKERLFGDLRTNDVLVRDCHNVAMAAGLSESDFYLLLAYRAVKEKERLTKALIEHVMCTPQPILIQVDRARELGIAPAS